MGYHAKNYYWEIWSKDLEVNPKVSSSKEANAAEVGRLLFSQECHFVTAAANISGLPPAELPEIAFAGRSNVGKSSLINALTNRNTLARTSNTPGRTRNLNFFNLGSRLMLVDLPGYGYARAPRHESKRWAELITAYFNGRTLLRRLCFLVDARHGLKPSDIKLIEHLDEAAVGYQVVLTKVDKVSEGYRARLIDQISTELVYRPAALPDCRSTSSRDGTGIIEMRTALATLAASSPLR